MGRYCGVQYDGWWRRVLRRQINKLCQAMVAHTPRRGRSKREGDVSDQTSRSRRLTYEIQILRCARPVEHSGTSGSVGDNDLEGQYLTRTSSPTLRH